MHRRGFIRLVGGGTLMATGGLLGACSSQYPASAVAAWQGPARDGDLRRWALAHAVLAPSSHNRQPWQVDLRVPGLATRPPPRPGTAKNKPRAGRRPWPTHRRRRAG